MQKKSLTELRAIAQAMGCVWGFGDDHAALIQKIELKRDLTVPVAKVEPIPMPEDQRIRSVPPAKVSRDYVIEELIKPYVARGLTFTIDDDGQSWQMCFDKKQDSGTMRQPPRNIIRCAEKLLG